MKKIEAIIRVSRFDEVKEALHEAGIEFFTYWDVTGVGNEKSGAVYRATVYETRLIERRMITFICRDQFAQSAVDAIVKSAKTGELGDGKVFISTVDDSVRIRTGESGPESLYIKD